VPQFRESNVDLLTTVDSPLPKGGVIVDSAGAVRAFLASFIDGSGKSQSASFAGLPSDIIADVAEALSNGQTPPNHVLGVSFRGVAISAARDRGLSEVEAHRLATGAKTSRILAVTYLEPGSDAWRELRQGDLLLSVNGTSTSSWRTVERAALMPSVILQVWREGEVKRVQLNTKQVATDDLDEAMVWAGALLHAPHRPLLVQQAVAPEGVYVAWRWFGSPADRYNLNPTWRIVAVDDQPVNSLAAFRAAVAGRENGAPVRLAIVDLDDRKMVVPLRLDTVYWPASTLRRTPEGWIREEW
jgi:S1-C subfamily serine protease